ncbi:hypothetical protein ACUY4R_000804 [Kosakonia sp. BK9b]
MHFFINVLIDSNEFTGSVYEYYQAFITDVFTVDY